MDRFVAITTEDRVGLLRRAWIASRENTKDLIDQLHELAASAAETEEQDIQTSSSNSHSATSQSPGAATYSAAERTRAYNQMIEAFLSVRKFLKDCCKYGQDAFAVFDQGYFSPNLVALDEAERKIVDNDEHWLNLCEKYEDRYVKPSNVIDQVVGDGAIYLWLLDHPSLLTVSQGPIEIRHDFTEAIIGRAGGRYHA